MKQPYKYFIFVGALGALALGYQNCGADLSQQNNSASGQSGAPFAYSVTADRLAYMSCTNATNSSDFFTLKTMAVDTTKSGITLTTDFFNYVIGQSQASKLGTLNADAYNQAAQLQFSLRPFGDLTSVTTINGNPIYQNILSPLNQSPVSDALVQLGDGQYLSSSQFPLAGSMQAGTANTDDFRAQLNSRQIVLAYTYLQQGQAYFARTINSQTPGTGYSPQFDCGGTPANIHVLCSVQELALQNLTNTASAWDCPSEYQFKIVRNGEASTAGCNFGNPPTSGDASIIYNEVKKILGNNWKIDVTNQCVMPTSGSCYDSSPVDYQLTNTCDQPGQPICAKHLSVCLKDD